MTRDEARQAGPHAGTRLERHLHGALERGLESRGWTPRVTPFTGYGGEGWVRVLARVVLAPPGTPRDAPTDGRGWRHFLSPWTGGATVEVEVADAVHEVESTHDGYVDVRLPADLPPGWATARLSVGGSDPAEAPLRIVGPGSRLGLLSDIDDTVIVTMLPRPLVAFRNAFLVRQSARRAVPGMAELYREIVASHPDAFVVYLSTGAWNTAATLSAFLERHGYPAGPLLLTDWGPTQERWFRSGPAHKRAQLARLFEELPHLRWLLVGDDGQHDPTLYAEAAASEPDKVLGVAIRQLTLAQHLIGHGTAGEAELADGPSLPGDPVLAPDGFGLRDGLARRGLVLPDR